MVHQSFEGHDQAMYTLKEVAAFRIQHEYKPSAAFRVVLNILGHFLSQDYCVLILHDLATG